MQMGLFIRMLQTSSTPCSSKPLLPPKLEFDRFELPVVLGRDSLDLGNKLSPDPSMAVVTEPALWEGCGVTGFYAHLLFTLRHGGCFPVCPSLTVSTASRRWDRANSVQHFGI